MKDTITLKKVIWSIIGVLLLALIVVPVGETLIYQSRYKNPNKDLIQVSNDDFDMYINSFKASTRDGFVNVDIVKKNDKWKFAEIQVLDSDGYIVHREFVDLRDVPVGSRVNVEFSFKAGDAASLNIIGSDEIKEPITILNNLKNKIKETKIYKAIEDLYNKNIKDKINLDLDGLKAKINSLPGWLKGVYMQVINTFTALDPGLRAIILVAIGYVLI